MMTITTRGGVYIFIHLHWLQVGLVNLARCVTSCWTYLPTVAYRYVVTAKLRQNTVKH